MGLVRKRSARNADWRRLTITQREFRLRARATPEEIRLRNLLMLDPRTRGRFQFQAHLLGFYPDFCFKSARLIVELDGSVHCGRRAQLMDKSRTRKLTVAGYRVIRFWNSELRDERKVLEAIVRHLDGLPQIVF